MANHLVRVPDVVPIEERLRGEPPLWPQEVLDRHGLRQLRPAEAVPVPVADPKPGEEPSPPVRLRSTVYRAATVLIPERVFRKARNREGPLPLIREVAGRLNLEIVEPNALTLPEGSERFSEDLADLPRPAVLRARKGDPPPDAWVLVQHIRQAMQDEESFRSLPKDDRDDVELISIEHVFSGAMIDPAPLSNPHPGTGDDPQAGWRSGYGRRPVTFIGRPPARPDVPDGSRRPVIAILDTGLGSCSWFGTSTISAPVEGHEFATVLQITHEMIKEQEEHVAKLTRSEVLLTPTEHPIYSDSISQVLAPATGHGTFIAGLIRQYAPGADVLSIRTLQPDSVAYESDVVLALYILLAMQIDARKTDEPDRVDVISLSLGCYVEDDTAVRESLIAKVIEKLTAEGVVVVAAAGNHSTARPYVPAALSAVPDDEWNGEPVIGVGALNSNNTVAWFSNTAPSASIHAPGANLVSVFPDNIRGSNNPPGSTQVAGGVTMPKREGADPDNYLAGAATWSGTSFSAPIVAAEVANLFIDLAAATKHHEDETKRVPDLGKHGLAAKHARATAAVKALYEEADATLQAMAEQG